MLPSSGNIAGLREQICDNAIKLFPAKVEEYLGLYSILWSPQPPSVFQVVVMKDFDDYVAVLTSGRPPRETVMCRGEAASGVERSLEKLLDITAEMMTLEIGR